MLLGLFLIYLIWPTLLEMISWNEIIFWILWLSLFLLVFGANLASMLQINSPSLLEQKKNQRTNTDNH